MSRPESASISLPEAVTPRWRARRGGAVGWRLMVAGPAIAAVTTIAALVATDQADVSFRDPDHVAALYIVEVGAGIALLIALDVFLRAGRRTRTRRPSRAAMSAVRRERWTGARLFAVATATVSFYLTYLAYRNLKAVVPLLRPDELFDAPLADLDRALFLGHDPGVLLHGLLGTGISTHVLSTLYVAFIVFLPLSLGLALVFAERLQVSLFYAATLSINWILGAGSYLLLPSLGPVYFEPATFASLPHSEVTNLQEMLLDQRVGFLADPATGTPQAIAAFASLHIAMSFTALLAAYLLGLRRWVKWALWIWLAFTFLGTIYLGWHYVVDDLAGLVIGAAALVLARAVTGFDPRSARGASAPAAASPLARGSADPEADHVRGAPSRAGALGVAEGVGAAGADAIAPDGEAVRPQREAPAPRAPGAQVDRPRARPPVVGQPAPRAEELAAASMDARDVEGDAR